MTWKKPTLGEKILNLLGSEDLDSANFQVKRY